MVKAKEAMTELDLTTLHATFCALTGLPIRMHMRHERAWADWMTAGHTLEDLKLVIPYLVGCVKRQERNKGCLRFTNLVERPDVFEDERAEAYVWGRNQAPRATSERKRVLAASGRPQVVKGTARPVAHVVARIQSDPVAAEKAYREFVALKGRL